MRSLFFIVTLLTLSNILLAQNLIPRDSLIADFNDLTRTLESTHPDPYSSFGGKIQFHREAQLLRDEIPQVGLSLTDFVHFILKFTSKLHDGHTAIDISGREAVDSLNLMLPIKLKIAEDGLYVSSAVKKYENSIGGKILSIENHKLEDLLQTVSLIKPSENIFGSYQNLLKMLVQFCTSSNTKIVFSISAKCGN